MKIAFKNDGSKKHKELVELLTTNGVTLTSTMSSDCDFLLTTSAYTHGTEICEALKMGLLVVGLDGLHHILPQSILDAEKIKVETINKAIDEMFDYLDSDQLVDSDDISVEQELTSAFESLYKAGYRLTKR